MSLFDAVSEHPLTPDTLEAKGYVYSDEIGCFNKKVSAYGNIAVKFLPDCEAYQVATDFYSWVFRKEIWIYICIVNTESEFFDAEIVATNKIKNYIESFSRNMFANAPTLKNVPTFEVN